MDTPVAPVSHENTGDLIDGVRAETWIKLLVLPLVLGRDVRGVCMYEQLFDGKTKI